MFGGENVGGKQSDIWIFDTIKQTWSKPPNVNGATPSPRSYHSAFFVDEQFIFVFGGDGVSNPRFNLHHLDIFSWTWTRVEGYGSPPATKKRHSMVYHDYKLWVFGGFCLGTLQHLSDLDVYDIATEEWTRVKPKGPTPEKRAGHVAEVADEKMYVWGGFGPGGDDWNLLHYYDFGGGTWRKAKLKGTAIPSKRCDHSIVAVRDGSQFVIFGGLIDPKSGEVSNEVYLLDVKGIY